MTSNDPIPQNRDQARNGRVFRCVLAVMVVSMIVWFAALRGTIRPVRIAGGSMAESLYGDHWKLTCPDCSFPIRYDADRPPQRGFVVCANCGYRATSLDGATRIRGQRVLIDRLIYRLRSPRRWETVAFQLGQENRPLGVKRIVGLSGERIAIRRGNIWADDRLCRKSLQQFRQLAIPVHIDGYRPDETSLPARWRANSPTDWQRLPGTNHYRLSRDNPDKELDWLRYHNWPCYDGVHARTAERAVSDRYGYNQDVSRNLHSVTDLLLRCQLRVESCEGTIAFSANDGVNDCCVQLDLNRMRGQLLRGDVPVAEFTLPSANYVSGVQIEFALCDDQILLAINQQSVLRWEYAVSGDVRPAARPLAIGASGCRLEVWDVQVWRDVYYLAPGGREAVWKPDTALGENEFLLLGDNVPDSEDGRHWSKPGLPRQALLGRVLAWPDQRR